MDTTEKEYFELKYLEEIDELFNECKELTNFYNLTFLENKNFTNFYEFITEHVMIYDLYNDESISDDENDI